MQYKRIIAISILIIMFSLIVLLNGCQVTRQIDPCEREYTNCVSDCGEGILSSICKEKCTYDRNECQKSST